MRFNAPIFWAAVFTLGNILERYGFYNVFGRKYKY